MTDEAQGLAITSASIQNPFQTRPENPRPLLRVERPIIFPRWPLRGEHSAFAPGESRGRTLSSVSKNQGTRRRRGGGVTQVRRLRLLRVVVLNRPDSCSFAASCRQGISTSARSWSTG